MRNLLWLFLLLIVIRSAAQLKPGSFITRFGTNGSVINPENGQFYSIGVQPSGAIIVSREGPYGGELLRYNADGSQDLNFGGGRSMKGIAYLHFPQGNYKVNDLLVQPDGKIVVLTGDKSNWSPNYIFRFNKDGIADGKFGGTGRVAPDIKGSTIIHGITLDASGKIIVTGTYQFQSQNKKSLLIAKFNADGTPDYSFNSTGIRIVLENDGKDYSGEMCRVDGNSSITVTVSREKDCFLRRYTSDGKMDPSFGVSGQIQLASSAVFDVDGTGKVAYADDKNLTLLNANGTSITRSSLPSLSTIKNVIFQRDGKILLVIRSNSSAPHGFWLEQLNANGSADYSFGKNGDMSTAFGPTASPDAAVVHDYQIYVAGYAEVPVVPNQPAVYFNGAIAVYQASVPPPTTQTINKDVLQKVLQRPNRTTRQ